MRIRLSNDSEKTCGFTILEVMIALFIFALVLTAIYATWTGIMKGTASGIKAANEVQRSRMAIRSIEDALLTAVMYNENMKWYYFVADTKGDLAALSFVSRLPPPSPVWAIMREFSTGEFLYAVRLGWQVRIGDVPGPDAFGYQ